MLKYESLTDNQQKVSSTSTDASPQNLDSQKQDPVTEKEISEPSTDNQQSTETREPTGPEQSEYEPKTDDDKLEKDPKEIDVDTNEPEEVKQKKKDHASKENPEAIPTAGGERLGEKHMGESKMVPDLPPKRASQGGDVSSSEGQPDRMLPTDQCDPSCARLTL